MIPISTKNLHDLSAYSEKSKGCAWGRTFSKIISCVGQVAKAALVFGFFLAPAVASSVYMTPGHVLARGGTTSCGLNKYVFTPEQCNEVSTALYSEYMLSTSHPLRFTQLEHQRLHDKGVERQGQHPYEGTTFRFFISQKRMENYQKALFHANWAFFSRYRWDSPQKTIGILKEIHRLLVDREDTHQTDEQTITFIEEFHRRMRVGGDYIDHASFFHTEFARIAPFNKGVGRLARLMVNIILEIGEHSPVVFADHKEYTTKVREGTLNRAFFTEYLRKSLEWTKQNVPQLDDASRRRIIEEARVMHPGLTLANVGRETTVQGIIQKQEPEKYFNYQQALSYLQQQNIFKLTSEQLINLLNSLHIILTQNLEQDKDDPFILGKYRSTYMIVDGVGDPFAMILRAQVNLGTRFDEFIPLFNKVTQDITHLGRLNAKERALWGEIAHIPPPPDQIAKEMRAFAKSFVEKQVNDPYELASFVHMEIARIWPYGEANGRLARMMMNEVLRLNGKKFITFATQTDYYKVVAEAMKDYSKFTRYLHGQVGVKL